jgi:hypothetical protein
VVGLVAQPADTGALRRGGVDMVNLPKLLHAHSGPAPVAYAGAVVCARGSGAGGQGPARTARVIGDAQVGRSTSGSPGLSPSSASSPSRSSA